MRKPGAVSIIFVIIGLAFASITVGAIAVGAIAVGSIAVGSIPQTAPTFSAAAGSPYAVGAAPASLVVADLNQDGIPDVAVANGGTNSLTVYYGQSGAALGTLGGVSQISLGLPGTPSAVNIAAVRTLDSNLQIGYPQLLGASNGRNIFAAAVNGSNAYGSPTGFHDLSLYIPAGQSSRMVVTGDFDGDGRGDDAVLTSDNQIVIEKGGASSSTFFERFTPSVTAVSIAAGDLNGDGRADLAIAAANGAIVLLTADANGSFKTIAASTLTPGVNPVNIAIGDVTGDGINDIVVTSAGATVTVFPGTGGGSFGTAFTLTLGNNAQGIPLIGDFNRDFLPDLVVPTAGGNVNIFLGQGNKQFSSPVAISTGANPSAVGAGDFNQDGKLDLVVVNQDGNTISLLLNTTPGIVAGPGQVGFLATTGGSNPASRSVQLFFDDSGSPTVTLTSDQKWLSAVAASGNLANLSADITGLAGGAYAGHITINANGYMPAVIAVNLQVTTQAGTFAKGATFATSLGVSLAVGDFNNDGKLDIIGGAVGSAFPSPCYCFETIPGNNDGTFGAHIITTFSGNFQPTFAAVGDFNGDGNLDAVFADYQGGRAVVMFGDGTGHFKQSPFTYNIGLNPVTVVTGDFNRDGKPDVAILCTGATDPGSGATSGEVWIFLNDGTGVFATTRIAGIGDHSVGMAMADVNNDGFLDLAVVNKSDRSLVILQGMGNGQFNAYTLSVPDGYAPVGIAAGDFDGDGLIDLALTETPVGSGPAAIHILLGNGGIMGPYASAYTPQSITPGDFDGDGNLDLALLLSQNSQNLQVGLGDGAGGIVYPSGSNNNFTVGGQPAPWVNQIAADFNGDGRLDLLTWDSQGAAIWYGAKASTTTVASSTPPTTAASGVNTTFTGTLSVTQPAWATAARATGTLTVNDVAGATIPIGAGSPASGAFTTGNLKLAVGAHTIEAVFAGDLSLAGSTSKDYVFTVSGTAGAPFTLTPGGTPQSAAVSTAFASSLTVTVKDASNNLLSGVNVTFTAPGSGASGVFGNSTNTITIATNPLGVASASFTANATLGGPYTVTARVNALSTSFSLTNTTVLVPASLTPGGGSQSAVVTTAFANPLTVTVKDANNIPLPGVNVVFTAPASGASGVFGNGTNAITIATDSSGVASAAFTANATVGAYTVTAAVKTLGASFSLTNTIGQTIPAGSTLTAAGTPQSATVNTAFGSALSVTLKDSGGNPLSGVNVAFTSPVAGPDVVGGLFANNSNTIAVATNSSGVANAAFTANSKAGGPYTVTATAGALTANFSLTNTAGAAANVVIAGGDNQSAVVGQKFAAPLAAQVTDAFGNPVKNAAVTLTAPATGPGGTFPGGGAAFTATTNAQGAIGTPFTANAIVGSYTVNASGAGKPAVFHLTNTSVGVPGIHINAAANNQLIVVGNPSATPFQVFMTDGGGASLSNVPITFTAPSSGPSGKFTGGLTVMNTATAETGSATAPAGFATSAAFTANNIAGAYAVVASSPYGSVVFNVTNLPGPPTQMAILSGNNQAVAPGSVLSIPLTVQIADFGGNPISGQSVTFSVTPASGPGGAFSGNPTVITDRKGSATAPTFTANNTVGSYTVTARFGALQAVFSLTNRSVAAVQAVSGNGQDAAPGGAFGLPLAARVLDANNLPIPGVSVTFAAPGTSIGGPTAAFNTTGLSAVTVSTNASGIATTPTLYANNVAGTYQVVASAGGKTAAFALNNGLPVQVAPSSLAFTMTVDGPVSSPQALSILGSSATYSAAADSTWLKFSFINANTLSVSVDPTGLAPGSYAGNITVSGITPVPVTLVINDKPAIGISPANFTFAYTQGKANPADQSFSVTSTAGNYTVTADVSYVNPAPGSWLSVTANGGMSTPATLHVVVNPAGLAPGTYRASIRVTVPDLGNSVQDLPVSLLVSNGVTTTTAAINAIVNAASSQFGAVSAGEIVTLYGTNVTCGSTPTVQVNGKPVQVLSAKSDQINFVIPDAVAGQIQASVQVNCGAASSGVFTVPVAPAAPGIFTGSGGAAAAYNQNGKVNSPSSPAPRGSVVTIYGTGFGALKPADANGLRLLVSPVSVSIGGLSAQVLFAGAAPGLTGVVQINAQIPAGVQTIGAVSLQVAAGVTQTQSGMTLSVN